MLGFEMSENRESKKPLRGELVAQIWEGCKDQGVLFGRGGLWGQVISSNFNCQLGSSFKL